MNRRDFWDDSEEDTASEVGLDVEDELTFVCKKSWIVSDGECPSVDAIDDVSSEADGVREGKEGAGSDEGSVREVDDWGERNSGGESTEEGGW